MISIITVTYNSEKTVRKAIESVVNQTYPDVEYIIVDGGSNDETVRIVREYTREYTGRNGVDRIISEPDDGIYDAMNKGIRLAQGDYVGLLNSDDRYKDETALAKVADAFTNNKADIVFGDIEMVNDKGEVIRRWAPGEYEKGSFFRGWHPPHPGLFVTKQFYEKVGLYQTDMQVAADFEFMLRAFEKNGAHAVYLNAPLVVMSHGGISTGGVKGIVTGNHEILRGFQLNGYTPPPLYTVRRFLSKVKQYIA